MEPEVIETVRINFAVSWKDRKKRRIRTRNDFVMVPKASSWDEIHTLVKQAVASRHPNTLLIGYAAHNGK